jgi:hypothetical protein
MSAWGHSNYEAEWYAELNLMPSPYHWLDVQIRRYFAIDDINQYHYPTKVPMELRLALAKTANPELKARILFLTADLWPVSRNWWNRYNKANNKQPYTPGGRPWKEFMDLRENRLRNLAASCGNTTFVREAGETCSMLKEFL